MGTLTNIEQYTLGRKLYTLCLTIVKWGDCMHKKSMLLVSVVAVIDNLNSIEIKKGGFFNG